MPGYEAGTDGVPENTRPVEEGPDSGLRDVAGMGARPPRRRTRRTLSEDEFAATRASFSPQQRLLALDAWQRSGLPAGDFAPLVGVSKHTLYNWKKRFSERGPEGLADQPRGAKRGSRLDETTKRAILMMKQDHPDWGGERISAMLLRGPALPASPGAVLRVLKEAGYETVLEPTRPHPDKVREFERARPNQLWQTDLFCYMLKRQNRRVHVVVYMDDHSRFITAWGMHASASSALVQEVFESGIASFGAPEEVLTDNGPQYITWRGTSRFAKLCQRRGIKQIVARPRRPQTLGKVERFWGTLWRECLERAIFVDIEEARIRIGHFVDYYNFQRPHGGIEHLVPADRFFGVADAVKATLQERVAANALELARNGMPKKPLYLTGTVGEQAVSIHAAGDTVYMQREDGEREAVALEPPDAGLPPEPVSGGLVLPDELADLGAQKYGDATDAEDTPDPGAMSDATADEADISPCSDDPAVSRAGNATDGGPSDTAIADAEGGDA